MTLKTALFETMVVGSLPRPQWIKDLIEDRKIGVVGNLDANGMLDQAVPLAIQMQERAGLDFVSDGEWRRESYMKVFSDAVDGFENDLITAGGASPIDLKSSSPVSYPAVVSTISRREPITLHEAKFLREHTSSKTIVAIPSPYTLGRRMWSKDHSISAYPEREDFMHACVPIIQQEIQELASIGIDSIQLDDPWLSLLVDPDYRDKERIYDVDREIELSVNFINKSISDAGEVSTSVHLCHAHWNRAHMTKGPYDLIVGGLQEMKVDRVAMELATPDSGGIKFLKDFPSDKVIGLGVIDHTNPTIETVEEVVTKVEAAMEYIAPKNITLNPDCGFSPSSANPMDFDEAYLKLQRMCQAADYLRERY